MWLWAIKRPSVLMLTLLLVSCGDGFEPTPIQPCDADQEVAVVVESGPQPIFRWSPACGMASLQVFPADGTITSGWAIYTGSRASENPLRSGVRYGDLPEEALQPAPATPLEPEKEYTVTVYRWTGDANSGALVPEGMTTFQF